MKTLCAAVLLLAACRQPENNTTSSAYATLGSGLVLETYAVPGDGAAQLRAVLKDVFWAGSDGPESKKFLGRAEIGPDGKLVVMAPPSLQEGVKSLIESMGKSPPKAAPTLDTTYWVVLGVPGKSGPVPAALMEVAPALQQIEKSDGPTEFTLAEKLTLTQISGESARANGQQATVRQVASANANGISSELMFERWGQKFETRVNLTAGQTLVLGSSGAKRNAKDDEQVSLYVLLRTGLHDRKQ